jgi:glycosyltransferase involved in cell wall biosynthesis
MVLRRGRASSAATRACDVTETDPAPSVAETDAAPSVTDTDAAPSVTATDAAPAEKVEASVPASPRVESVLRLLVVSSDRYPPRRVDVSVLFGEELARRGHRIDWILQSEAACARAYTTAWGGGTVLVGPTDLGTSLFRRIRKHALGIRHDLNVFRLLRSRDYDMVEVKDKFLSGVSALLAAKLHGKRFVYWLSYPFPEEYLYRAAVGTARYPLLYRIRGSVFKVLLYRFLLRLADHVFVQSEQMRRDVAAHGIPPAKMTAVPMGIDLRANADEGARTERRLIPPGRPSFLYLGTLSRVRRLDFLVRVLAMVRNAMPDTRLYMVGRGDDPADEQFLLDEASRLGVSSTLILVGQLPREEALKYVRDAGVCVSPFYPSEILNSTSPTKLVEYMAMGKAVVANDHPEQRRVIEESGAGRCVSWNEQEFAEAIVGLLRAPDECERMGRKGRRYVEEHRSYEKIADLVEKELARIAR